MGLHSYTQPSLDSGYSETVDGPYSETDDLIRMDQEELSRNRMEQEEHLLNRMEQEELSYIRQYPPQPEVEFGFPQSCYCGGQPHIATSYTKRDPGRRFYTCANRNDGDCHVWKWWDDAVMEEMRATDRHILQLAEKVDALTLMNDNATDQKLGNLEMIVAELGNKNAGLTNQFEKVTCVLVIVLVVLGLVVMFK